MNESDAARIFAILKGAYPYAKVDAASVAVWANSLATANAEAAMITAEAWIEANDFFPTIQQFNGVMTEVRREQQAIVGPPALMRSAIRCDGSGWFDRGKGQEPCPTCNPWLREQWLDGKLEQRLKPPSNYLMPERCQPSHAGEIMVTSKARAMQLVIGGLREQLTEDGKTPEQIDEIVARRMPPVLAAVAGASDA